MVSFFWEDEFNPQIGLLSVLLSLLPLACVAVLATHYCFFWLLLHICSLLLLPVGLISKDSYPKELKVDNQTALLDVVDTAGLEEFYSMQDQWIREGKGFILVYSITSRQSFIEIARLREKILSVKGADEAPMYAHLLNISLVPCFFFPVWSLFGSCFYSRFGSFFLSVSLLVVSVNLRQSGKLRREVPIWRSRGSHHLLRPLHSKRSIMNSLFMKLFVRFVD